MQYYGHVESNAAPSQTVYMPGGELIRRLQRERASLPFHSIPQMIYHEERQ